MKAKMFLTVFSVILMVVSGLHAKTKQNYQSGKEQDSVQKEITGTIKLRKNDNYAKRAKVSLVQAYRNFLTKYKNAKVVRIELSEDNSYLIYDLLFIGGAKGEQEAKIDAGTGRILAINKAENNFEVSEEKKAEEEKDEKQGSSLTGTIQVKDSQQSQFPNIAKINPAQAARAVQKQIHGKVIEVSLENENDFLVYSVVIDNKGKILDFKVDAGTGKVIRKETDIDNENESDRVDD